MKKAAALSLATFYLFLTTGMFVCFVSCGAKSLIDFVSNPTTESHHHDQKKTHCQEKNDNHCDGDEGCSCCKQHGNYSVKENIRPDTNFQFLEIQIIAENSRYLISFISYPFESNTDAWPKSNSPPYFLKEPLYISFHSLLI